MRSLQHGQVVKLAPDQHEADRQIVREAARHGNGGVPGDVEWTSVAQHVECGAHVLLNRAAVGRERRRNEGYGRQREHVALCQCTVIRSINRCRTFCALA